MRGSGRGGRSSRGSRGSGGGGSGKSGSREGGTPGPTVIPGFGDLCAVALSSLARYDIKIIYQMFLYFLS